MAATLLLMIAAMVVIGLPIAAQEATEAAPAGDTTAAQPAEATVETGVESPAAASSTQFRFVHVVPAAAALDIYTDGQLTLSGLDYGSASGFVQVSAGDHSITATQAGTTTPLWEQTVTAAEGTSTTLIASSTDPLGFQPFADDLNPLALGEARLTAIHAIAGGPTIDVVLADGRPVIPSLQYNVPYGTLDLPTLTYDVLVVPEGQAVESAIIPTTSLALASGTSYVAVAYGTLAQPGLLVLEAQAGAEEPGGYVRFVHGVDGAPAIDVYLNDALVAPALAFATMGTPYIAVPAGEHDLAVRLVGQTDNALTGTLTVAAGEYITAAALGTPENAAIQRFGDDLSAVTPDTAVFALINSLEDDSAEISATLADGDALVESVAPGEIGVAQTSPAETGIVVNTVVAGATNAQPIDIGGDVLYGGVYYSALAAADAAGSVTIIPLMPYSLAQGIASAPGDATIALNVPDVFATTNPDVSAPTVVTVPTNAVEIGAEATAEVVIAATLPATADPALATLSAVPTDAGIQPTLAPTRPALPVARVLVDPGVALNLREFPRSDAFSFGGAPSSALLDVLGRAGLPQSVLNATPDPALPEATAAVDPASLLPAGQDLDPAQTWLYVNYSTPDGGTITAWVNALYLAVSDPNGNAQRLANLPVVPPETAGEAQNTQITAPEELADVVYATVGGLDAGVSVNIRRTIGTDGEALARVTNGTSVIFEGVNSTREWVLVRYTTPEGANVRGWIASLYIVDYTLNTRSITLEALEQASLLPIVADDVRGTVGAGATTGLSATATPNLLRGAIVATIELNAGANLQLRRRPSVTGESLGLVPSGTQVVVTGRTTEGEWLYVEFGGIPGYIYSQYVSLTLDGRSISLTDVPVLTMDGTPVAGTPVPAEQSISTQVGIPATAGPGTLSPVGTPLSAPAGGPLPVGTDDPNLDPI